MGAWAISLIAAVLLVLAAPASASEFKSTEYPADVLGEQEGPQELGSGIEITEQGSSPQFLEVEVALTGIHYLKLKDGLICPLNGTGTGTDGALASMPRSGRSWKKCRLT